MADRSGSATKTRRRTIVLAIGACASAGATAAKPDCTPAMPEYPDIALYREALSTRLLQQSLRQVRLKSPFLLRTHTPSLREAEGKRLLSVTHIGKRIVLQLEDELSLVLHLMIAGRLRLKALDAAIPGKVGLAAFDFEDATLLFTEASPKKRTALHLVHGAQALRALDPGGVDPMEVSQEVFARALRSENHTLKRSLTDPRLFAGIGNAYSDEILHHARLSPVRLTSRLEDAEIARLYASTRQVLGEWLDRLREKAAGRFPDKVTAFHPEMAVHGKFGQPCPVCGGKVQRIRRAENEANYCPACQTEGRLLSDRSLSRLLHDDWPRTPEELEEQKAKQRR